MSSSLYMKAWPPDALERVGQKYFEDIEMTAECRKEAVEMCKQFHESCRALAEKYFNKKFS